MPKILQLPVEKTVKPVSEPIFLRIEGKYTLVSDCLAPNINVIGEV